MGLTWKLYGKHHGLWYTSDCNFSSLYFQRLANPSINCTFKDSLLSTWTENSHSWIILQYPAIIHVIPTQLCKNSSNTLTLLLTAFPQNDSVSPKMRPFCFVWNVEAASKWKRTHTYIGALDFSAFQIQEAAHQLTPDFVASLIQRLFLSPPGVGLKSSALTQCIQCWGVSPSIFGVWSLQPSQGYGQMMLSHHRHTWDLGTASLNTRILNFSTAFTSFCPSAHSKH